MVIQFKDEQQLEHVALVVRAVAGIYDHSAVECLSTLANKLDNCNGKIDLSEDHCGNDNYNEVVCLYNIMKMVNDIGADEYNACSDIYIKLKKYTPSVDAPKFEEMLVEAELQMYIKDTLPLFTTWIDCHHATTRLELANLIKKTGDPNWLFLYECLIDTTPCSSTNRGTELEAYERIIREVS